MLFIILKLLRGYNIAVIIIIVLLTVCYNHVIVIPTTSNIFIFSVAMLFELSTTIIIDSGNTLASSIPANYK